MKIVNTNIENLASDKKALYKLTKSSGVNVRDLEPGQSHRVDGYALYTEDKEGKDGVKEQTVLAVILSDGTKIQTISPTFIKGFMEIVELMEGEDFAIVTNKSVAKSGREFVYCELDCN